MYAIPLPPPLPLFAKLLVCEKVKKKRNGQFPNYLAREILTLYQEKFPPKADDQ